LEQKRGGVSHRIVQAMAHPVRIQVLNILGERVASPNQIAGITGENLGTVAYHVRVLLKSDFIELASTESRRGATEHFYRINPDSFVVSHHWQAVPPVLRGEIAGECVQELSERVVAALEAGTFAKRDGSGLAYLPLQVDEKGWKEILAIVVRSERAIRRAGKNASERLRRNPGISVVVALAAFEAAGDSFE
jgi:DNA-binding transcriptional ArsR family regulator